ncbi:YceG family protein [Caminicella sporogenes]|uniref:YceG family protein n=1 Tax=Caminicella sporogenes TaxID=166485 RepID=UPI00253FFAD4|nr:YceG family protein [Caminicella sporogenes]WIF95277.1 YceG family protein [Caminicella sporogenes]
MINYKKIINPILLESKNILEDILLPLHKRQGFIQNPIPSIPLYFYRYIGIKENEREYFNDLHNLDMKLSNLNNLYLKITNGLPIPINNEIVNKTIPMWNNIKNFDIAKKDYIMTSLINLNTLPKFKDNLLNSSIIEAFKSVFNLYIIREQNINITKIKNFSLKLLTWINKYTPNLFNNFEYSNSKTEIFNPKLIFYGDIKRHEIYFLIFLSLLGCDVLYINSHSDGDFDLIDRKKTYSKVFRLPKTAPLKKFPENSKKENVLSIKDNNIINTSNKNLKITEELNFENIINTSLKTSNNLFEDITTPLNKRSGFISHPIPIIPIYFYRYIGISEIEEEYYNELFRLDKKLSQFEDLYIKFTDRIPAIANNELINKTNSIWKQFDNFDSSQIDVLVYLFKESGAFIKMKDNILYNSIIQNFKYILNFYIQNEKNINLTKIKNFSLKLLSWIYEYAPILLNNFNYSNKEINTYNPKILYYGEIKSHEVYFLILMSKLGCDILYINSFSDSSFPLIDKDNKHSKIIELPKKSALKEFPKSEILIRYETEAFKASREISNIIYSEQDGLYKPWQFETYYIQPVTLKTTYDELKILWNEEARLRSGFKIENNTVYIPNLFAKISGVYKDIQTYWNEFVNFKNSENTLFIPSIPFTNKLYSDSDLYFSKSLFNKDGSVDKNRLFESSLYKFSYLKTPLQNTIINKINDLFKLPIFNKTIDFEFKQIILLTILNMDKRYLNLIQLFDYPFKIPKLIIYDNNENIFSLEDSIIIGFLYLMGFDILIFTPTGYNNIEQRLSEKYYDIHKLESIAFDLSLPDFNNLNKNKRKSFFADLFGL